MNTEVLSEVRQRLKKPSKDVVRAVQLQKRDYEILLFLNEMGPSEAVLLGLRHFATEPSELTPARIKSTKERLTELSKNGFLATHRLGTSGQNYFRTTPLGIKRVAAAYPDLTQLTAISNIALGTFEHHQRVAWCRVALEKLSQISGWRSERRLTSADRDLQRTLLQGKMPPYIPDGVYLEQQKRIIFELELAAKTDAQMNRRIENLLGLLTYMPDRYQSVHIVCSTAAIRDRFLRLSQPYSWKVETLEHLLSRAGIWGVYEEYR